MKNTRMLQVIAGIAAGISMLALAGAAKLEAAEPKIAYVDLGRAFDEYEKTRQLDKQLEQKSTSRQAEREAKVNEIRKLKDELEIMSEKGREQQQGTIEAKIKDLQEFDRKAREALKEERDGMVKSVLKEIEGVIKTYAQQNGYTLVLSDRAVLYAEKTSDVTEEVLKTLNGDKGQ
ncbi:MAG: OmpH family outer membrane protein [Candidatus Omnitrophica bacterium]|nr:OmpH family outer membrane protein [Candidatus Omnitrophota bacterium]